MKIAFRCDASAEMGIGHLMRCLTLAEELTRRGAECLFVISPKTLGHKGMIEVRGFASAILDINENTAVDSQADDPPMAHWLPWGWRQDAEATKIILAGTAWDWIVADHYALNQHWHEAMRMHGLRVFAIDDTADRMMAPDVLLDHNASAETSIYLPCLVRSAKLLLGPAYALIRPEVAAFRKDASTSRQVQCIIVTFGGATPSSFYHLVAQSLATLPIRPMDIVLIGVENAHVRTEIALISEKGLTVSAHGLVGDMPARYAAADICIGAAGVSALERALIGIPSLTYVTAANQRLAIAALARAGAIIDMGDIKNFSPTALVDRIVSLTYTPNALASLAENGQRLVPGGGPERAADIFFQ